MKFEILPSPFEEYFDGAPPAAQTERLAEGKVKALISSRPELAEGYILGADTVIDLEGRVLGKPDSLQEADTYLSLLSGKTHRVITSLALSCPARSGTPTPHTGTLPPIYLETEITEITFSSLSKEERRWYLSTEEWKDAAGAYRIQGAGALFVEHVRGCYFNVMGLPLHLFYGMLTRYGYGPLQGLKPATDTSSAV